MAETTFRSRSPPIATGPTSSAARFRSSTRRATRSTSNGGWSRSADAAARGSVRSATGPTRRSAFRPTAGRRSRSRTPPADRRDAITAAQPSQRGGRVGEAAARRSARLRELRPERQPGAQRSLRDPGRSQERAAEREPVGATGPPPSRLGERDDRQRAGEQHVGRGRGAGARRRAARRRGRRRCGPGSRSRRRPGAPAARGSGRVLGRPPRRRRGRAGSAPVPPAARTVRISSRFSNRASPS